MGFRVLFNRLHRCRERAAIAEVIEITTRLERHFAGYARPGTPGSADSAARTTAWIREQITGAGDRKQLHIGARAALGAMRGGMASLTDTYVCEGPEDFDMIDRSWKRLRAAMGRLEYRLLLPARLGGPAHCRAPAPAPGRGQVARATDNPGPACIGTGGGPTSR